MKITALLTAILFHCMTMIECVPSATFSKKAKWKDEFSGKGAPNSQMWTRSVTKPGEQLSAYQDADLNAYVKNGKLHLRILKTDNKAMPYTAGRLIINKDFHFKKGKLVVRAKAPLSKGVWPAIWLNGPKTKDGYFAELDLMEHVHSMGENNYEAVYHLWGDFRGKKGNHVSYGKKVNVNVGRWHVYTLEITDDMIVMKVDDNVVYDIRKNMYGTEWPTDQEYSLRLAMAYGGYGANKNGIDDSSLPAEMLVDYVRFYEYEK